MVFLKTDLLSIATFCLFNSFSKVNSSSESDSYKKFSVFHQNEIKLEILFHHIF